MVDIYSTQRLGSSKHLTHQTLLEQMNGDCSSITIITAYYSQAFFQQLVDGFEKQGIAQKTRVSLIVSLQSKLFTKRGLDELQSIKELLGRIAPDVRVRINEKYSIMHSKVYRFYRSPKAGSIFLTGSANASNAAFRNNEELLIKTGKSAALASYCKNLFSESTPIERFIESDSAGIACSNLASFFQQGFLFVKYPYPIGLTYKFESLSRRKIEKSNVLGLGPGEKFGEFSLEKYFKVAPPGRGEQIKKYSIQTNFGLWVPAAYLETMEEIFHGKQNGKSGFYQNLLRKMDAARPEDVLDITWKRIENEHFPNGIGVEVNDESDRFCNWYNRIQSKLTDICKRQSVGDSDDTGYTREYYSGSDVFYLTPMPSIWNDESEAQEFIDYFFEAVDEFGGGQGRKASSLVASSIRNTLASKVPSGSPPDQYRGAFEIYLQKGFWRAYNWQS